MELGPGGRAAAYRQAPDTMARILDDARRLSVDHLIVSGDLTAYATHAEFQGARAALGDFADDPARCSVVPGNHDRYSPEAVKGRWFEQAFPKLLQSDLPQYAQENGYPLVRLLGEEVAVIGLCSARVPPIPGASYGFVGRKQRAALAALLQDGQVRDRTVLAVVHHAPLLQTGEPDRLSHGLVDAEALLKLLSGPRRALLHGHVHRRFSHPATSTRPQIFGAGSSTQAGHEGYWLLEVDSTGIRGVRRGLGEP
jgi:3',5'-cyclic AMP phosphodiesterase CpdA